MNATSLAWKANFGVWEPKEVQVGKILFLLIAGRTLVQSWGGGGVRP